MSEPKFTPGPWVLRPGICRNDHPDTSADVHGPQGQFVADCGCHETATANARLIAAAPRMYELLTQADEVFSNVADPVKDSNNPVEALRHAIAEVVAKVRG